MQETAQQLASDYLPAGWDVVTSSVNARVAHHSADNIFFKEFLPRSPLENLKALVKGSRAKRARLNSETLLLAGLDAPANLAWGKLSSGNEYLFTAGVVGDSITRWLREKLPHGDSTALARRRQLLHELGRHIGRLHATGFIHGDLRTSNVLASLGQQGFRFALIDNERNLLSQPAAGKDLKRNLMQLNMFTPSELSRSDRWRFFTAWQQQMRELSELEGRILAVESYQWAMRRLGAKGKL